ncbi:MAG: C39 family peptidase [Chloroflexota bacterium]
MKLFVSPKVDDRGLRMRSQPGFTGEIVAILQAGEMLETLEPEKTVQDRFGVKEQWLHVKNSDGQTGYCAAWLLMKSRNPLPPAASRANSFSDTRLQENPELKQLSKFPYAPSKTIRSTEKPQSELEPLADSKSQGSPHKSSTSSELTPLPALETIPKNPKIFPPPATSLIHHVPILSQDELYDSAACSPVSACMLLEYYHHLDPLNQTITPRQLITMLDPGDGTPGKGMSLSNVTDELLSLGYQHISEKIHASMGDLRSELAKGPLIVTMGVTLADHGPRFVQGPGDTIHAMVVKGFNPDEVILNDPWSGKELRFSEKTFESMWTLGQNGMYMIRP